MARDVRISARARVVAAVLLLLPWFTPAPVPCGPELFISVEVAGVYNNIGLSQTREHGVLEERGCDLVNDKYEGMIVLGCDEGTLNATAEGCVPRHCSLYTSVTARIDTEAIVVMPLERMEHEGTEARLCREVNPTYRGPFTLFCNFGELTLDLHGCYPQWDPVDDPPWVPRSQHAVVGLSDGAVLMLAGLGQAGPNNEVWEWKPHGLTGTWEQAPEPPWSGRFGAAAVWQVHEEAGEQVLLLGGNDDLDRSDVWRWLRRPAKVQLTMEDSDDTGTVQHPCTFSGLDVVTVFCDPGAGGVQGRRWFVAKELDPSTEIHLTLRVNSSAAADEGVDDAEIQRNPEGSAAAIVAVQLELDGGRMCRHVFALSAAGRWLSRGCADSYPMSPGWSPSAPRLALGGDAAMLGEWRSVVISLNRSSQTLHFAVDGEQLTPADGVPVGPLTLGDDDALKCPQPPPTAEEAAAGSCGQPLPRATKMALRVIELVARPGTSLEAYGLSLLAPPGHWQMLAAAAPWPARSSHAAVALPDGDVIIAGGVSASQGLLNDVWRWSPVRCTLLEDMGPVVATRYEMECGSACRASAPFGQWRRLPTAPWLPRQGHKMLYTAVGVLLIGGSTAAGFEADVWQWVSSGSLCSLSWQGRWKQLSAATGFAPRYGHSAVGLRSGPNGEINTVVVVGGYGGDPVPKEVVPLKERNEPIRPRNDIWCGSLEFGGFNNWTQIAPYGPFDPRSQHSALLVPTMGDHRLLVIGGYNDRSRHTSDLWMWSGENATVACDRAAILGG